MQLTVALITIISTVSSLASALKLEGLAKALEILPLQGIVARMDGTGDYRYFIALILPDKIKGEDQFRRFQIKIKDNFIRITVVFLTGFSCSCNARLVRFSSLTFFKRGRMD